MARFRIILGAFLVCAGLLAADELALRALDAHAPARAESQWGDNLIRAQSYVYDGREAPVVLVGSSLATRLEPSDLPADVTNLAFNGMGALDGLRLLVRSGAAPRWVLVETNVILRPEAAGFVDGVFAPGLHAVRRRVRALREGGRPVGMVIAGLEAGAHALSGPRPGRADAGEGGAAADPGAARGRVAEAMLEARAREAADPPPEAALTRALDTLGAQVAALERRGTRVAFFELPTHPRLCASDRAVALRGAVAARFAPDRYPYLAAGDCAAYRTTDGLHLDRPSARRYAARLAAWRAELP